MPTKISNAFRQVASDGRIGKSDVEHIVKSALDGQGITKTEAAKLEKLREQFSDKFTTKGAQAFDNFFSNMKRSWSRTKHVHLPNADPQKVKALLESDPRISIMTGHSVGGGEAGSSTSLGDSSSVGGGEAGGNTGGTTNLGDSSSVGGGEAGGSTSLGSGTSVGGGE